MVPGAAAKPSARPDREVEAWVTVALGVHLENQLVALPRWHSCAFAASCAAQARKRAALELELAFQVKRETRLPPENVHVREKKKVL